MEIRPIGLHNFTKDLAYRVIHARDISRWLKELSTPEFSALTSSLTATSATVCCTLVKAFEHVRRSNSLWVSQLYRNGILYSLCMLILSLCNMIVSEMPLKDPVYTGVMTRPQRVMESILCSRVFFVILEYRKRFRTRQITQDWSDDSDWHRTDDPGHVFTSILMSNYTQKRTDTHPTPEAIALRTSMYVH
ncbi:hypothetical protein CC2G_014213 [Coprinopsis cinerea AmutBmut pab1-1]|nr:hypothetical protein CC2G_014213 [Coprinopsis cinerea AmutBmut pab1-1]